jgi:hypothetical protein
MKKGIGIALVSILLLTFLAACGIPQDKYDKVNSDLTVAQTQIQSLQSDLTAKNAELAAKDTELKVAQSALSAKETELKATREKMGLAKSMTEVINGIFVPGIKGEFDNMTEGENINFFLSWRDKVNAIGDPTLTAKFKALIDGGMTDEAMLAFFVYLFESVPKILE